jgi:signal transduction histidine kinase/methanogenic corrinoid protein MtbC1
MRRAIMPDIHKATSQVIDDRRVAMAEAIVARQYALRPDLEQDYGPAGRARCIQDTKYHLSYLSAAIAVSSPALFSDYLDWARSVLAANTIRDEDVESNLACMQEVLREALPEEHGTLACRYIAEAVKGSRGSSRFLSSLLSEDQPHSSLAEEYLRALLNYERQAATRLILDAVDSGVPIQDIYLQVFQRCQREVGRLWQTNQIGVAQEHYCSAATQFIMAQLYSRAFPGRGNGRRVVAASVGGELHEIGLRIVSDFFEMEGYDTLYLGANTPTSSLIQAVADRRADLLLLSATMTFHLPTVESLITAVRGRDDCRGAKILVGGHPFNIVPDLWRKVGADGYAADAREALAVSERLLADQPHAGVVSPPSEPTRGWLSGLSLKGRPGARGEHASLDELTRLNNDLVTLQRELTKKNRELERLNEENDRRARQLAESNRRKDEFLALLGHELRNPLATIQNALHLLRSEGNAPSAQGWPLGVLERQAQTMSRLVDDLLDVSRIRSGKIQIQRERLDLARLVEETVSDYRGAVEAAGLTLDLKVPGRPAYLLGDPTRLAQMLGNLLKNASKFTDAGGRIAVKLAVDEDGRGASISVRDSGIGIEPEMLPRVFKTYAQADRSLGRSQGGLGLGLALVKGLAELHGGRVQAASEGAGRGAEFTVWLPLTPEAPAPTGVVPPPDRPVIRPWRILVIEDNQDAARTLQRLLRRSGHEVEVADSGPAGLERARAWHPEIVLCDLGLPGMDGFAVARALRGDEMTAGATLIAITGYGLEEDRQRCREAGFDRHLTKPVNPEELHRLLGGLTEGT